MLDFQYQQQPDACAIQFVDGPAFTFDDLHRQSCYLANGLVAYGLSPGDKVASLLPTGPELCLSWLGIQRAGGVFVPLNTELLDGFLRHALALSEARILICEQKQLDKLQLIAEQLPKLQQVFVVGDYQPHKTSETVHRFDALMSQHQSAALPSQDFQQLACLLFTSGTTGPSKAVMMPHAHCFLYGLGTIENLQLQQGDSYYICMPLNHANGLFMQLYACLILGIKAVIRSKFSASRWLSDIQRYQVTHTNLLGVMSEFILRQPVQQEEQSHALKAIAAAPASAAMIAAFQQRFGVAMYELYGMSEVNIPLYTPMDKPKAGSCGRPYSRYFEVRIACPATDLPCESGEVGEIQVRPKLAAGFMSGYYGMPDKTVEAWRNLWFHTGDLGRCDEDGYFYFVDRLKDSIRRRGENISSYEIETTVLAMEGVTECAAYAVPSDIPDGEDEVMLVVVTDAEIKPEQIHAFCQGKIPGYAMPRFIRLTQASELPTTATNKIQKNVLRQRGVDALTWDSQQF
ncbi:AMP-binding protein [Alkalimonas delamerensis]|uniref:AMP-binding protein n=1 Tax=Alkalimonas delamerensis TaxID=265981 RepID=A0ABT9GTJ0_9GAMM|nr:AMP-binding protein [Alkalimonas delamerensis]MDP4530300.1 AMP-binding protein [Alkalimonas delamerensis]